jgi:hypothetical protein
VATGRGRGLSGDTRGVGAAVRASQCGTYHASPAGSNASEMMRMRSPNSSGMAGPTATCDCDGDAHLF